MGEDHQNHGEATEGVDVLDSIFIHGIKGSLTLTLSKGRGNSGIADDYLMVGYSEVVLI